MSPLCSDSLNFHIFKVRNENGKPRLHKTQDLNDNVYENYLSHFIISKIKSSFFCNADKENIDNSILSRNELIESNEVVDVQNKVEKTLKWRFTCIT